MIEVLKVKTRIRSFGFIFYKNSKYIYLEIRFGRRNWIISL
jgi:hypothetical protein